MILLAACASEKLALAPPADVDFSGNWKLNKADSDDPQLLLQSQTDPNRAKGSGGDSTGGGPSGGGGRGGKRGGQRSNSRSGAAGAQTPPSSATLRALGSSLRWPAKDLRIKQVAGTVEITSENITRTYHPADTERHMPAPAKGEGALRRDAPPQICG